MLAPRDLPLWLSLILQIFAIPYYLGEIGSHVVYLFVVVHSHPFLTLLPTCFAFILSQLTFKIKNKSQTHKHSFILSTGLAILFFIFLTTVVGKKLGPPFGVGFSQSFSEEFKLAFEISQPPDAKEIMGSRDFRSNMKGVNLIFKCNTKNILPSIKHLYTEIPVDEFRNKLNGDLGIRFHYSRFVEFKPSARYFFRIDDQYRFPSRRGLVYVDMAKQKVIIGASVVYSEDAYK